MRYLKNINIPYINNIYESSFKRHGIRRESDDKICHSFCYSKEDNCGGYYKSIICRSNSVHKFSLIRELFTYNRSHYSFTQFKEEK